MITLWTQHLKTDEEKQRFKHQLIEAEPVLKRLDDLLSVKESEVERAELAPSAFDNPSWPYKQAYRNGCRYMLQNIRKLLDHKDTNE